MKCPSCNSKLPWLSANKIKCKNCNIGLVATNGLLINIALLVIYIVTFNLAFTMIKNPFLVIGVFAIIFLLTVFLRAISIDYESK